MYVIFPADEVVYLSYGRLIYVPQEAADGAGPPVRTSESATTSESSRSHQSTGGEPAFAPAHAPDPLAGAGGGGTSTKRRPSRFNFGLLKRTKTPTPSEVPSTPRVRCSIAPVVEAHTPPVEAFKKFCTVSTPQPEKERSAERNLSSDSKRSSKRSSASSKVGRPPSIPEELDSKRSSKISSNSSKSTGKQNSADSSNNSSLKRSKRSPNHLKVNRRPSASREEVTHLQEEEEEFYPLSTRRERTYTEPIQSAPTLKKSPRLSSNSFRLPFRKDKTPEVPPLSPERKSKKSIRDKDKKSGLERKLSYSDYLAVSREKTTEPSASGSKQSEKEKTKKSEKSPVLRFFRRSSSPKNLGVDRTPLEQSSPSKSRRSTHHHQRRSATPQPA